MKHSILILALFGLACAATLATELVSLEPIPLSVPRGPVAENLELDELFEVRRYLSAPDYYLNSGAAGDTMCVVFQPMAPCSVYYGEFQWFLVGAEFEVFLAEYNEDCAEYIDVQGRSVERGTSPYSPIGEFIVEPILVECEASGEWESALDPDNIDGGAVYVDAPFVLGFVKTQPDSLPFPLADDVSARGYTYTWFGGPWTANDDQYEYTWGSYSSDFNGTIVELMARVWVSYGTPPIIISRMSPLPNTADPDKVCTIDASILYCSAGYEYSFASLIVEINNTIVDSIEIEVQEETFDVECTFDLGQYEVQPCDTVEYWIHAYDADGNEADNYDWREQFHIVELEHPNSPILLVTNYLNDATVSVLEDMLHVEPYSPPQRWDCLENGGLDANTVGYGNWNLVFVAGWGCDFIPTRDYGEDPFSEWLSTGGHHLLYIDQDYFYVNNEGETPTFGEGDFAYDVFGIASGWNNPQPADSVFDGIEDDPISGLFYENSYTLHPSLCDELWTDYVTPTEDAMPLLTGHEILDEAVAVYRDGPNKTAAILMQAHWAVEATVDSVGDTVYVPNQQYTDLISNLIAWYDVLDAPEYDTRNLPGEFTFDSPYPNPFNSTTRLRFALPAAGAVTLEVFDVLGRKVSLHQYTHLTAGWNEVAFSGETLASGVYFLALQAGDQREVRKIVLLR